MRLKIHGGTITDGKTPLCTTCRWATIIRGAKLSDEITACGRLAERDRITFPVASCSSYSDRTRASLHDLEDIAWVLRSDRRTKKIGFVRARDLQPADRHVLDDDDYS